MVAEDDRAERRREPQHDQPFHHVAATTSDLSRGIALSRQSDARDAARYEAVVFETANLLASYPTWNEATQFTRSDPPLVPSQENYPPRTTADPTLEIAYFHYGLSVAQQWRERLGMPPNEDWARVMAHLSPLPQVNNEEGDGLYVGARTAGQVARRGRPSVRRRARSGRIGNTNHAAASRSLLNRDHPSFVMAYGYLPGDLADAETMRRARCTRPKRNGISVRPGAGIFRCWR